MATLAFVRSLIEFQGAMVIAAGAPSRSLLAPTVDLEEASETLDGARAWVAFLRDVETGTQAIIERAEQSGLGSSPDVDCERGVLVFVTRALRHAEEHARQFRPAS